MIWAKWTRSAGWQEGGPVGGCFVWRRWYSQGLIYIFKIWRGPQIHVEIFPGGPPTKVMLVNACRGLVYVCSVNPPAVLLLQYSLYYARTAIVWVL